MEKKRNIKIVLLTPNIVVSTTNTKLIDYKLPLGALIRGASLSFLSNETHTPVFVTACYVVDSNLVLLFTFDTIKGWLRRVIDDTAAMGWQGEYPVSTEVETRVILLVANPNAVAHDLAFSVTIET